MGVAIWKVHLANGFFLNWNMVPSQGHGYEFNVALIGALVVADADRSRRLVDGRPPRALRRSRGVRPRAAPGGQSVTTPGVRLGGAVITNPTKPFWPDDGLTKLDLAQFYARIAGQILPWMKGRAVTLERCPEGIRKTCFFQKQAPANLPADVPTVKIPAPSAGRDVDYIVGGTRKTLLTLVNLGCIAMHVMNSRVDQLDKPDWLAFDLDPADGFASAARVALLLRDKLEDHGLEPYVKTSGGRGLHVFVPLRRGAVQDKVRAYASAIAERDGGRASEARDRRDAESEAPGAGVSRRHAQRVRADDRAAVLGALAAPGARVDAARLGRGQPASRSGGVQHQDRRTAHGGEGAVVELLRPPADAAARV